MMEKENNISSVKQPIEDIIQRVYKGKNMRVITALSGIIAFERIKKEDRTREVCLSLLNFTRVIADETAEEDRNDLKFYKEIYLNMAILSLMDIENQIKTIMES